jgi:hypothetical protein
MTVCLSDQSPIVTGRVCLHELCSPRVLRKIKRRVLGVMQSDTQPDIRQALPPHQRREVGVVRSDHGVALQVEFERHILKPVFHLIGYRLWF